MREILGDAEVTRPTPYHYFGNTQALLVALLRERLETFFEDEWPVPGQGCRFQGSTEAPRS